MRLNPLLEKSKKDRPIDENDYDEIRHHFIRIYGWQCWKEVGLDEAFSMLPKMFEEVNERKTMIACLKKLAGVKER